MRQLYPFFWLFSIRNCLFFSDIFNLKRQFYGYLCGKYCYYQAISHIPHKRRIKKLLSPKTLFGKGFQDFSSKEL
ncbi:hypothetical protein CUN59_18385 [Cuspidothrix issatschenkoi CHARLIE-1]|uniref:Uncharacterized protein n=1 Tax=Cuspidothrix issatschenkoi CHARLIE-1 TaxID=2052836 RepID=A0A2S6CQE7_9CYAN|nr:hypothetical protein CUN59_18385 [Cuspidothrix issatschenkoi CHARLIE-1]